MTDVLLSLLVGYVLAAAVWLALGGRYEGRHVRRLKRPRYPERDTLEPGPPAVHITINADVHDFTEALEKAMRGARTQ